MEAIEMNEKVSSSSDKLSFDEVSLLYVRFLRLIGLLPFEGRNFAFIGSRLLLVYFFLSSLVNVSSYVCFCLNTKELRIDTIADTVIVVGSNLRFFILISKRYRLNGMLRQCISIWSSCNEEGRLTVLYFERKLRILFQLFAVSCCFINILYPINALITKLPPLQPNDTTVRRILPYKWYGDNTADYWPGYWTNFFLEMLVVQNAIISSATCDVASPFLMILGTGYLRHLRNQLLDSHRSSSRLHLVRLIIFHQRILGYCAKIEKFARMLLLIQVFSAGYNLSLILFKLVSSDPDKFRCLSILCVCICQLYLCQWTPDYLFDESQAIIDAAYFAAVHWMPRQMGKYILLIITRAQRPVQMTAGGFVNLSLQSFGSMLTSAFSFFTVLRNCNL